MKKIITILLTLNDTPGKTVLFEQPVIVKKDGISILECWGAAVVDGLWLMDETGNWYELSEEDRNADVVIDALYTRLVDNKLKAA